MSSFTDLAERLAALEAKTLGVDDLPMADLQRRLEQRWQPDATTLLPTGAITRDLMAQKLDYGTAVLTWPGASANSNVTVVPHHLGVTPLGVIVTSAGGTYYLATESGSLTTVDFHVDAQAIGATPAVAYAQTVNWLAFA